MKNQKVPLVTVLATSYNSMVFIKKFTESVMRLDYPNLEILIMDNHSTDGSYEWLVKTYGKFSHVRLIQNSENIGLSRSRTKGLQLARGKYVTLVDVDARVDKNWIKESVKLLEERPDISAIQSVVYDLLEPDVIEFAGLRMIPQFGWVIIKDFGKKKVSDQDKLYETFPCPMGIVFRKSIFKTLGYFDPKISFNIDDVDFGFRFSLAGFRCFVNPKAKTYHLTFKPRKEREKVISRVGWEFEFMKMPRIFLKNYQWHHALLYLPIFLTAAFARAFKWLLKGETVPIRGLLWSIAWNMYNLSDTLKERARIQKLRKIPDSEVFRRVCSTYGIVGTLKKWLSQLKVADIWSSRVKRLPSARFLLKN